MAGVVGPAKADWQSRERCAPSPTRFFDIPNPCAVFHEEEVLVIDLSGTPKPFTQIELTVQHGDRPREEFEDPILACLRCVLVETVDARFRHTQRAERGIKVRDG
jgi:hypothetical protein